MTELFIATRHSKLKQDFDLNFVGFGEYEKEIFWTVVLSILSLHMGKIILPTWQS